ncbi:hypothetical protein CCACVL1_17454 [Corchorus capsularis]|uniref:F-box domain-containing protein n=1 Tax=Corchorus capsularis TaxID=210143 RepID=A0A1R3HS37_COCAP|nr:hypothetical protein CCACVL1_17454 [Corchorus capsularis]
MELAKEDECVGESRLMWLPLELQQKILELLPASDLARLTCVSYELKTLCDSQHDLWNLKFRERFPNHPTPISLKLLKQKLAAFSKYRNYSKPSIYGYKVRGISIRYFHFGLRLSKIKV